MKRWAVAAIGQYEGPDEPPAPKFALYLADGTYNDTDFSLPRANYRGWSKAGFGAYMGQVSAKRMDIMQGDPDIYIIPDAAMDIVISTIPASKRTEMRTWLEARGFAFGAVKSTWTVRQLLVYLRNQIQPSDTVEDGDIPDLT